MASYDPNGYMQYASIRDFYTQLTNDPNSQENVLSNLWFNILREYFLAREGFGLEIRPRLTEHDDVTIQYVNAVRSDIRTTRVILAVDERVFESQPPDSAWSSVVSQLTECMKLASAAQSGVAWAERIFGIATIGCDSRFYVLGQGEDVLSDYPAAGGESLEFEADESRIVELLMSIKAEALPES